MRKLLDHIVPVLMIWGVLIFTYQNLTRTFFQQDEWQYFGSTIYSLQSSRPIANILLPLKGQITHFFPLATALFLFEYLLFKTNFLPYVVTNLLIHAANALLLYFLIFSLTRKELFAWGSALLFSVNSIAHQPITWVAAGIGTLPGTFFLLLFFLCLVRFGETKRTAVLVYGFLSLLISILFKETSLFVFLFLPLVLIVMKMFHHQPLQIPKAGFIVFVSLGFFYVALRIFFLITPIRSAQPEIGDVTTSSAGTYIYRFITIPLKVFPESIIPFPILRLASDGLVRLAYPQFIASDGFANPYITESIVFDLISYLGSALLLFLSFVAYRALRKREPAFAQTLVASVLFIGTSAVPFMFVPGRAGFFSIFEPRNLYVVSIGSSVWVSLMLYVLARRAGFVLLVALIAIFHSVSIQQDIQKLAIIGTLRKHLLTSIEQAYPKLPQEIIFFTQSDRSYYGLPSEEKILPLQSGLGRMLMVWYQDKENFPGCLYENQFLHGIKEEGYRNCDGRGFGYARTYEMLIQILKENKLNSDNVIGYTWLGNTKEFRDITPELRMGIDRNLVENPL